MKAPPLAGTLAAAFLLFALTPTAIAGVGGPPSNCNGGPDGNSCVDLDIPGKIAKANGLVNRVFPGGVGSYVYCGAEFNVYTDPACRLFGFQLACEVMDVSNGGYYCGEVRPWFDPHCIDPLIENGGRYLEAEAGGKAVTPAPSPQIPPTQSAAPAPGASLGDDALGMTVPSEATGLDPAEIGNPGGSALAEHARVESVDSSETYAKIHTVNRVAPPLEATPSHPLQPQPAFAQVSTETSGLVNAQVHASIAAPVTEGASASQGWMLERASRLASDGDRPLPSPHASAALPGTPVQAPVTDDTQPTATAMPPQLRLQDAALAPLLPNDSATGFLAAATALGITALRGALALYHRIEHRNVLRNARRAAVLAAIEAQAGLTITQLVERTGIQRGTLSHHLRVLERVGAIAATDVAGRRMYSLAGLPRGKDSVLAAAPSTFAQVLAYVQAHPGATASEVGQATGLSSSHVAYYVKRFEAGGVLRREREGQRVRLFSESAEMSQP